MSEREKGQTTESWGWAGRRPPDWADFRGSRGRHGTWPASACARGTSTTPRTHQTPSHHQSSHLLNFSWGPRPCVAPHTPRPPRPGIQEHQSQPGFCDPPKSSTPNCAVVGSHPQSSQPNATDCLVCCTPSWPTRHPLTWSGSRAGTSESQARPSQRLHRQPCCPSE